MNRQMNILVAILVIFMLAFSACKPKDDVKPVNESCLLKRITTEDTYIDHTYNNAGLLILISYINKTTNVKINDISYNYNSDNKISLRTYSYYLTTGELKRQTKYEYTYTGRESMLETITTSGNSSMPVTKNKYVYVYDGDKIIKMSFYQTITETFPAKAIEEYIYTYNSAGKVLTELFTFLYVNPNEPTSNKIFSRFTYRSNNTLESIVREDFNTKFIIGEEKYDDKESVIFYQAYKNVAGVSKLTDKTTYEYTYISTGLDKMGVATMKTTMLEYKDNEGNIYPEPVYSGTFFSTNEYACPK